MDPVATAIISSLTSGLTSGVSRASEDAIRVCYQSLKDTIRQQLGPNNEVNKAIDLLETDPEDITFQQALTKVIQRNKASRREEIFEAAQEILKKFENDPRGSDIASNISSRLTDGINYARHRPLMTDRQTLPQNK